MKPLKVPTKTTETGHRALTVEEQKSFMDAVRDTYYYEFFAFLLLTGVRQGEASALQWGDIDWRRNVIHVSRSLTLDKDGHVTIGPPKSQAGKRDIPINDSIREILQMQQKKASEKWGDSVIRADRRVFPSSIGKLLHNPTVNKAIRRTLGELESTGIHIEPFTAHTLRSTFATRFIEQGGTPQTLKTLLGHSSLKMTMDLYAHVLPNTKQKEMDMVKIDVTV